MEANWIKRYKETEIESIHRICEILPSCQIALSGNEDPFEDKISLNIMAQLNLDSDFRRKYFCTSQYLTTRRNTRGAFRVHGKMDFMIMWKSDNLENDYLGYEVKKLNVKNKKTGHTESKAADYVTEGVERFSSNKYSKNLPFGCMLGIAMNGKLNGLRSKIFKKLDEHKTLIHMVQKPCDLDTLGIAERFESLHNRPGSAAAITVRHALVPFV